MNVAGTREARHLAALFETCPLAAIHSSPRRRCRETAEPIAVALVHPATITDALDEIDFGRFTGRAFDALESDPDWRRWNAARNEATCPGGETMAQAVARATAFLHSLARHKAPVLCVTHCDVIRGVVAAASGRGYDRLWELPCAPGSVTTLTLDDGVLALVALGDLPGPAADQ